MAARFNPNELYRVTALGRAFNPMLFRNHLWVLLAVVAGGVIAGLVTLLHGDALGTAISAGVHTSAAMMIAWILSRDIDPDNDYAAFLAAGVALLLAPSPLALASLAFLTILIRIVSRIVGPSPKLVEYILALALLTAAVYIDGKLIAFAGAVGFMMDARLSNRNPYSLLAAAASALIVFVSFVARPPTIILPLPLSIVVGIVILISFLIIMALSNRFATGCDAPEARIDPQRIQAAMLVVALTAAFTLADAESMRAFWPVWSCMIGVTLWRLVVLAVPSLQRQPAIP